MKPWEEKRKKAQNDFEAALRKSFDIHVGDEIELKGEIDNVRVFNERSGWGFGRIWVKGENLPTKRLGGVAVPIVGLVDRLYETAEVSVLGKWVEHPKFGLQLDLIFAHVELPNDKQGVAAWLADRFPDIGPTLSHRITQKFPPPGLWDVLEQQPMRLTEVEGIGETIAMGCAEAYQIHKYEREAFVKLASLGLKAEQIRSAIKRWRDKAIAVLEANPYELRRLPNIGWKQTDALARRQGMGRTDERRIVEGLRYALELAERDGHTCRGRAKVCSLAAGADVLGISLNQVMAAFPRAVEERAVIVDGDNIYRPEAYTAERLIADRISALLGMEER